MSDVAELRPNPGPQERFLASRADEVLYGGAAGGGKSFALLLWAARHVQTVGYRCLLLRRTYRELELSLIDESRRIYPWLADAPGEYNESRHAWTFPSGAQIVFGHADNERDVLRYQSAQFARIGIDQVESFTRWQYTYLLSRLRNMVGIPNQIRATANPGGIGRQWVKQRWVDRLSPGRVRWFLGDTEVRRGTPNAMSRQWIPARVTDNPHLMAADPSYVARLNALPERERLQLLEGRWDVGAEGLVYPEFDTTVHIVDPFPIPADWRRVRGIDFGFNNPFVCLWVAISPDDELYVYRELYETERLVSDLGPEIVRLSHGERYAWTVADHDAENCAELARRGVLTRPATKAVEEGIQEVRKRLLPNTQGRPRLYVMRDAVVKRDQRLLMANRPTSTADEFGVYSRAAVVEGHEVREEPVKENDHGMDTLRYICMGMKHVPMLRSRAATGV